jgi:hypothetical protein
MCQIRPLVAFDETGNTGQDLLNREQPIFVLASVCVERELALDALALVTPEGAKEAKFARLRTSNPGRKRLLRLMESPWIDEQRVKAALYHKPYMVTTKIVDMLVETMLHRRGHDLYDDGGNVAMSNLLHTVAPQVCGAERYAELLRRFIAMVREPSGDAAAAFYTQVDVLRAKCDDPTLHAVLSTLRATEAVVDEAFDRDDRTALDPAIPAFFDLASQWTATLRRPFDVAHDESKPLVRSKSQLELYMSTEEAGPPLTGPGPKRQLPLLSTGVAFAKSVDVPQIQLADLFAGALSTIFRAAAAGRPDGFARDLQQTRCGEIGGDRVWPSAAMSPDEYGHGRSSTALDYSVALAERERHRKARP